MLGTKRAKQFFQKHTNSESKKCWEKNLRKEERKKRFLYSHEYRYQKWGEIYALNNFSRNIRIVRAENFWKKSSENSGKNGFLYSHEYRDQKMGGGNAQINFSRNTRIVRAKNVGKKTLERSAKNVFYIHTSIVTKKWEEKKRETIFPETHE